VRTYFKFGYKDHPGSSIRLSRFPISNDAKDRPRVHPFAIQEAELIIAASHRKHGEWYGNYQEFLFFTALRQSEIFALEVDDCDLVIGRSASRRPWSMGNRRTEPRHQDREVNL